MTRGLQERKYASLTFKCTQHLANVLPTELVLTIGARSTARVQVVRLGAFVPPFVSLQLIIKVTIISKPTNGVINTYYYRHVLCSIACVALLASPSRAD